MEAAAPRSGGVAAFRLQGGAARRWTRAPRRAAARTRALASC